MGTIDDAVVQAAERAVRRRRGVVVGALQGDGRAVVGRGDDGRGGVPDGRTLFEIGSVTKVFTSLLLADGVVRGDWELSTPVAELLPGVQVPERDGTAITLEHLATHASGLLRDPVPRRGTARDVLRARQDIRRGRDPFRDVTTQVLLDRVSQMRLRWVPGSGKHAYSNTAFGLLGLAMARASGAAYDDLLRARVSGPLGLSDTVTRRQASAEQQARTAVGHCGRRVADPMPLDGMQGAGALLSTVDDLLRLAAVQLDPAGSALEEAVRLTQQPHGQGGRWDLLFGWGGGLGWLRSARVDGLWHSGGTVGFCSFVALVPATGVAVALLTNQRRPVDGFRLASALSGAET